MTLQLSSATETVSYRTTDAPRSAQPEAPRSRESRPGYFPALDGLRALAAFAVLGYHLGEPWAKGGLLGVDVFLVLSGFLITHLLLREYLRTERISLWDFWRRRVRRLLPGLVVVLVAIGFYAGLVADPSQRRQIQIDAGATLGYVANWRFAFSHQSYFHSFDAPSPLLHTWSLGVEEQFYLFWPIVILLILGWRRRRPGGSVGRTVIAVSLVGALTSAAVALTLALTGTDQSRIYYGTDTRAQALLIGAALAGWLFLVHRRAHQRAQIRHARDPLPGEDALGPRQRKVLATVGLFATLAVLWFWTAVPGESPLLDRGGFLLIACATAALIASAVLVPGSPITRMLCLAPLRYLGRISYGIYLWHWPVVLTITHARIGLSGAGLALARVATVVLLAAAVHAAVERPIRSRGIGRWPSRVIMPALAATAVVLVVAGTATPSTTNRLDALEQQSQTGPLPPPPPKTPTGPVRLLVVGDSVALTLGSGFSAVQNQYGVTVANRGWTGCGVARRSKASDGVKIYPAFPDCAVWPSHWAQWVDQYRPDVAAVLVGRWETVDRLVDGRWVHIGEPAFDSYLAGELDTAINTLSARGARVVLFTTPPFQVHELPDGSNTAINDPARVVQFNQLLRAAAARHPGVAEVIDDAAALSPDGRFHLKQDGVPIRFDDGIHITPAGGALIAKTALPEIVRLGRLAPANGSAPR